MAVNLSPYGGVGAQFLDNAGNVLTGGKIYTYAAGTTTPQATYTSSNGATPHSNPIILDASGRVPSGEIWLTDGLVYKFILRDSNDVLIATYDGLTGINSNFVAFTNQQEIQTATAGQTVFNLTTMTYQPGTNSLSVFVDGVNQYGPGASYAYLETDSDTVTFVTGLHVGAEVKFTTSNLNSSASITDAFQISYVPPFTGSAATNVGDKLAQTVSVKDFGAVGNGVVDDRPAFVAFQDEFSEPSFIPNGTYNLSANWNPLKPNAFVLAGTETTFLNNKVNYGGSTGLIPFQGTPIWSQFVLRKTYEAADWSNYGNIFHSAFYAKSKTPSAGLGGGNVVAVYGGADSESANSSVWAGNFVAYANNATATSIGIELNYGTLVSGGNSYGLIIATAGNFPTNSAIQIQANNANSLIDNCIRFQNRSTGLATGSLILSGGSSTLPIATYGINFSGHHFSGAEIITKALLVETESSASVSKLNIIGADTSNPVVVQINSTDTNVGLALKSKGAGAIQYLSGNTHQFYSSSIYEAFRITAGTGVDWLQVTNGTGTATLGSRGASANVDIKIEPKGTGYVSFGTKTASADAPINGYIEIKDLGGSIVKLAVIA